MLLESYLSFSVIFLAIGIGLSAFELITKYRILVIEGHYSAGKTMTASLFDSFFQQLLSEQRSKVVIGTRCIGALGLITAVLFQSLPVLSIALALTICSYALSPFELNTNNHTYLIICLVLFIGMIFNIEWTAYLSIWMLTVIPILSLISKGFSQVKHILRIENVFILSIFSLFWFIKLPYSWALLGLIGITYLYHAYKHGITTTFWALIASFPCLVYCRMMLS